MKKKKTSKKKILWYECKNGHKSQWNEIERLEINPHTYGQLIFNKGGKNMQWRKVFSAKKLEYFLISRTRNKLKMA